MTALLFALCLANDASYFASVFVVFKKVGDVDERSYGVVKVVLLSFWALSLWRVATGPLASTALVAAGTMLQAVALALFWVTAKRVRRTHFSIIYSRDVPRFVEQGGAYRFVRHPFYSCYMTSYVGVALATSWWPLVAMTVFMFALYQHAARFEEAKFLDSDLADHYRAYMRGTGRFVPTWRTTRRTPSTSTECR